MYQIIRAYNDFTSMTEHADSITSVLTAATIYLEDPDCVRIVVYDTKTGKTIVDYQRD